MIGLGMFAHKNNFDIIFFILANLLKIVDLLPVFKHLI